MTQFNLLGRTLGQFEILEELGRGGMAVVYKARQINLERIVALKVLPPDLTYDTNYIERFHQEARSVARLEHPHIMPIFEIGEIDNLHYIAMKYIPGRTLRELIEETGRLSIARATTLLAQVGTALDYAHQQGMIHRDIKPSNIMVTDADWAFLTDFGLARGVGGTSGLTMAGTVMGTPEYMSPEQAQGLADIGPSTDIYALGVVLYEALTGAVPFQADTPMGMLAARLLHAPKPPRDVRNDLPYAIEDVIMRALARKPEARFASAGQMIDALQEAAHLTQQPEPQRPVTPATGLAVDRTVVVPAMQAQQTAPAVAQPTLPAEPYGVPITPPPYAVPQQSAGTSVPPATAKRRRPPLLPLLVALLLLVVSGAITGLFLLNRNSSGNDGVAAEDPAVIALLSEGDETLQSGDVGAALDSYNQARSTNPDSLAALSNVAVVYNLRADWPQAEEYAQQLIDAAGTNDGYAALGYTLLAAALDALGDKTNALEQVEQAISIDSSLALAHGVQSNLMADTALERKDTALMDQALDLMDEAVDELDNEPPVIRALTNDAVGYTFSRDYLLSNNNESLASSESRFGQAITAYDNLARFHAALGQVYLDDGDYPRARTKFTDALDRDSDFAVAQIGLGWVAFYQQDYDAATMAFDAASAINDADYLPLYGKGRVAFANAEYERATELLNQAIAKNALDANLYQWLGEANLFLGVDTTDTDQASKAYTDAETAYRKALDINDQLTFANSGLGWVLQYQERYDESVAAFEQALKIDETNDDAHNGIGWSLINLERYDEAEDHFRRATELDPTYVNAFYGLGRSLEGSEKFDDARQAYNDALKVDPTYEPAQTALNQLDNK